MVIMVTIARQVEDRMRSALAGSIPPLVTPFRGYCVDEDTYAELV